MRCTTCKKEDELRFGVCFDCASSGEERAAKRSVIEHIKKGFINLKIGNYVYARYDFTWAYQRLTKTGDYSKDGTFDWEGYDWR